MINYSKKIGKILKENGLTVSTAESCTGGLVSSLLTDISGSSEYIKINFVTYANEAKSNFLGVTNDTLEKYGAVSEQTAQEMAQGLLKYANIGISTTGIAGPTGGTKEKPVGLMYTAVATKNFCYVKKIVVNSEFNRIKIKELFCEEVLKNTLDILENYYKKWG